MISAELRRDVLDELRGDDLERAVHYLEAMDAIYAVLVSIDFPDAITGGLRRTTDQLRGVLERTRGRPHLDTQSETSLSRRSAPANPAPSA